MSEGTFKPLAFLPAGAQENASVGACAQEGADGLLSGHGIGAGPISFIPQPGAGALCRQAPGGQTMAPNLESS